MREGAPRLAQPAYSWHGRRVSGGSPLSLRSLGSAASRRSGAHLRRVPLWKRSSLDARPLLTGVCLYFVQGISWKKKSGSASLRSKSPTIRSGRSEPTLKVQTALNSYYCGSQTRGVGSAEGPQFPQVSAVLHPRAWLAVVRRLRRRFPNLPSDGPSTRDPQTVAYDLVGLQRPGRGSHTRPKRLARSPRSLKNLQCRSGEDPCLIIAYTDHVTSLLRRCTVEYAYGIPLTASHGGPKLAPGSTIFL
jgi:hypothetical protein